MNNDSPLHAGATKPALRQRLKEALRGLDAEARAAEGRQICRMVREHPLWQGSRSVLGFIPRPDEPDIRPLLEQALAAGKALYLPAFNPKTHAYEARKITALDRDLVPGRFGIPEPAPFCALDSLMHLDLALVPGVGFAPNGCRLGRGNGYYDRLLSGAAGVKCGLAFACQLTDDIPKEPHDIPMNWVVLPSCWLACNQAARGS